ncbi:MAG: hypothetical protein GY820_43280 [Gammaproteobacteria bacterium]|nr:hypothetical protein [Gammaproteobacteria bacterium]
MSNETDYKYFDRNATPVNIGDILYYDEGEGYSKGIHEVVLDNGQLCGKTHLYNGLTNEWEFNNDHSKLVELKHYTFCSQGDELYHAEIIGNIDRNSEMLTLKWVEKHKPLTGDMSNKQTLNEIANMVCGDIPEDYIIRVEMENGYGGVSLWHNGEEIELDYDTSCLEEQINDALRKANKTGDI